MGYTQDKKLIAIDSSLGSDELLLARFSGTEGMSRLFQFELELLSEKHTIDFRKIIGTAVTVRINLHDDKTRYFNGIVSRFAQRSGEPEKGSETPKFSSYTATMVPTLWMLTRTADSRIFQNKSIPDIIEQIFNDQGFTDYEMKLVGNYLEKEYCVQYRETDFNFISRLMEQEGIFYYFKHEEKKHTLIIADSADENKACPNQPEVKYQIDPGGMDSEDKISHLEMMQEIRVAKYTVNDYNFKVPNTDLKTEVDTQNPIGPGEREVYDYPAGHDKLDAGERLANFRIQEEEAQVTTISGNSRCRDFSSGFKFDLKGYYRKDMNDKAYVLTEVAHEATEPVGAAASESVATYANRFTCIPLDVPFRPVRVTPKPVVEGTQPAIVVGPAGEEIYPDEYGRVKVQFIWDREGQKDENSSCWIRVSQQWAGANWGAMFIPHIGHEVIVDFIEGDPDRPIIIGSMYNGNNKPGDPLPDNKTRSVIRSWGDNDIIIEDKEGDKHIQIKQANGNEIIMHESTPNIEIKQACGNQILMRESEGIHMQDKYGNEVKLDAVAGTLKVRSPTHESVIELGKSIWLGTLSDIKRQATGNFWTSIHGTMDEYVAGPVRLKYDGVNAKIHGGVVSDTFIGGKHSSLIGTQLTSNVALLVERSKSKTLKKVDSLVKIDSQTETQVIGGGGDADTSKLLLRGDVAMLRCGDSIIKILKDGKIMIYAQKAVEIESVNEDITLKAQGGNINLECQEVKFKSSKVDFGKAVLNKGKKGTIFT